MADHSKEARERAETRFQKEQRTVREGEVAKAAREAQARSVDAKTAKLKALRMEKEAAEREAAKNEQPAPKQKKKQS